MISNYIYKRTELKHLLQIKVLGKNGNISQGKFKILSPEIINSIFYHTENCLGSLTERIFWILHDIYDYLKFCYFESCNNKITKFKNGYNQKFCCYSCNSKYQLTQRENPFSGESGILLRKKGMLAKYNVDHNMKTQQSLEKRKNTYIENYGVCNPNKSQVVRNKTRLTNEKNGIWTPKNKKDEFELYHLEVNKITNKQPIKNLQHYELRGHCSIENSYSLDHKFSIQAGFKNSIPPYIIGNICNLEFIPSIENSKKREKCSITLEELFDKFFNSFHGFNPF